MTIGDKNNAIVMEKYLPKYWKKSHRENLILSTSMDVNTEKYKCIS